MPYWYVNVAFTVEAEDREEAIEKVCEDIKGNEEWEVGEVIKAEWE